MCLTLRRVSAEQCLKRLTDTLPVSLFYAAYDCKGIITVPLFNGSIKCVFVHCQCQKNVLLRPFRAKNAEAQKEQPGSP